MTVEQAKKLISQKTGIPKSLLTGKTVEENIAKARELIEFKEQGPKDKYEQFADWFCQEMEIDPHPSKKVALDEIAEEHRIDIGGAAYFPDGTADHQLPPVNEYSGMDKYEQLDLWIKKQVEFDPRTDGKGWKHFMASEFNIPD